MLNNRNRNANVLPELEDLSIQNASIKFINLSAGATTYRKEGEERSFTLIIPDAETAERLQADGWNVRTKAPREEGDDPEYQLKVIADYRFPRFAPDIWVVTDRKKTLMTAETVGMIDRARIKNVDITVHAKPWYQPDGRSGYKAVVREMWVTIESSAFAEKYASIPGGDDDCPF